MRKNLIYWILSIGLVIITLILVFTDNKSTLKHHYRYFAISDTSQISKITIHSFGNLLEIEQIGNNWIVNRKYNAKVSQIKGLLGLLTALETNAPVPQKLNNELKESFKKNSTRVRIESKFKVYSEFELLETDGAQNTSIIRLPDGYDMYYAKIPGFNKPLSLLFTTNEELWRDNVVFRYKPWEILNINLKYPQNNDWTFTLNIENPENIVINNYNNSKTYKITKEQITPYLMGYSNIAYYSTRQLRKGLYDSLSKASPYCIFNITSVENAQSIVKTYTIPNSKGSGKIDLNIMYALLQNDTIPVIIKYVDIDPVMKTLNDFKQP